MSAFIEMLIVALYAAFLQNVVFSGAYGVSEVFRIAAKPKQIGLISLLVLFFSTVGNVICVALDGIPFMYAANEAWHILAFAVVIFVLFLLLSAAAHFVLHLPKSILRKIGVAGFNTIVIALPILSHRAAYTVLEALGAGVGAGIAFFLAALLLSFGIHKISLNENMPQAFRGIPALLLYTALLSLAFMGFSAERLFV